MMVQRDDRISEFFALARERYQIKERRENGVSKENWTADPIFAAWRFCNVFREDDKTTAWFREHLRDPLREDPAAVTFATVAFRWFNRIETGERILDQLLGSWDPNEVRRRLDGVSPLVTSAYMIKTPAGMSKLEGLIWCIENYRQDPVGGHRKKSMHDLWWWLRTYPYLGGFMAYEVVTDLRHTRVLEDSTDINTWAHPGPGAARGVSYIAYGDPDVLRRNTKRDHDEILHWMKGLLVRSWEPEFWPENWPRWELREVEHWLCEYWKYIRCRDYGQHPKQRRK